MIYIKRTNIGDERLRNAIIMDFGCKKDFISYARALTNHTKIYEKDTIDTICTKFSEYKQIAMCRISRKEAIRLIKEGALNATTLDCVPRLQKRYRRYLHE